MAQNLILVAIVLFLCLMAEKLSGKVGMPALILFMGVGCCLAVTVFFGLPLMIMDWHRISALSPYVLSCFTAVSI